METTRFRERSAESANLWTYGALPFLVVVVLALGSCVGRTVVPDWVLPECGAWGCEEGDAAGGGPGQDPGGGGGAPGERFLPDTWAGSPSGPEAGSNVPPAGPCIPDCAKKQCGDDGCGSACGTCPDGWACNVEFQCQCIPACEGKECGPDGCGGACGTCPQAQMCSGSGACRSQAEAIGFQADNVLKINLLEVGYEGAPEYALDLDLDPQTCSPFAKCQGGLDNQLGGLLGQLKQFVDVTEELTKALESGDLVLLAEMIDFDPNGAQFRMVMHTGKPMLPKEECDWQTEECDYLVDPQDFDPFLESWKMEFDNARIEDGKLVAGGIGYPLPLVVPVFQGMNPTAPLPPATWARVEGTPLLEGKKLVGLKEAVLGVAIRADDIDDWIDSVSDEGLPVSKDMLKGPFPLVKCDIDTDDDGELDAVSAGVRHEAIPARLAGILETGCEPQCEGKECGPDGCGWICGSCPHPADSCVDGACVPCTPQCDGKECGPDGCGFVCGICTQGTGECKPDGQCVSCIPTCQGKECGPDGCGGSCGVCSQGYSCSGGTCIETMTPQGYTGIRVELAWETPGDPFPGDVGPEAGADLDLHFVHPYAGGPDLDGDGKPDGWYDIPFDCFWFNADPDWGTFDPAVDDNPHLLLDDSDGSGPEILALEHPEQTTYRVGVHYWNDHGYGGSLATLTVRIDGIEVYQSSQVLLTPLDLWEAVTIDAAAGTVTPVADVWGDLKITPDYQNPYFFPE